jgi:hypothetical protein
MSALTQQDLEAFLPAYGSIPEKWDDARAFLSEQIKRISQAVNVREIGWMLDQQSYNGQQFIPLASSTSGVYRSVFRIVVDCGSLPNATTKSVAHGLTVNENFTLIHLYAAATKASSAFASLPIPYSSPTLNENIKINLDDTNINITTAIDYSDYTRTFTTIEYLLEA